MKRGLLERILTRRYGEPSVTTDEGLPARCWNLDDPDDSSALYLGMQWIEPWDSRFASLKPIYGDVFGGFLIKNTLKAALLTTRKVYGIWNIDDFLIQPEVQHALAMDPDIEFFMDAYMVYFYGLKAGELYVFDAETDELDSLGPIEPALETLMDEFEAARENG
jgi:hypothetical protein